jgi:hypothetical protein
VPIMTKTDKTSTTGSILNLNLGQLAFLEVSLLGLFVQGVMSFGVVLQPWTLCLENVKGTEDGSGDITKKELVRDFLGLIGMQLFYLEAPQPLLTSLFALDS